MPQPELASWMTPIDRDILELLENGGNKLILSPAVMSANLDWSHDSVRAHMKTLREQGLVEYYEEERGLYQLSARGRAWLDGELPTEDLEAK